ncbi:MAG: disulfide bond formation protein B [Rubrivivax sp.]
MTASPSRPAFQLGIAALCLGAVGAALVTQHVFEMQPCPWCVLQRLVFVCIALAALLGLAWRTALGQRLSSSFMLLFGLCGVAAALWQHFVAAASSSCKLTLAERIISGLQLDSVLPAVFQPLASCADAAVNLLGVPYEFWSLALFMLVCVLVLRQALKRRVTPQP